jgi:NADPH-dependent 2,4-dienoyl-CoA reductase/sulfur reductase-like enzyme/predicted acylesterase/phospholipase RssA
MKLKRQVDFLLLGGGLASATAAETLREEGADGTILIVSSEPVPPYHRPPLSKRFLLNKLPAGALHVLTDQQYRELEVDVLLGTSAMAINPTQRIVRTDTNEEIRYGKLLIATGGTANRLDVPGADKKGILNLRTLADAEALKKAAARAKRAVVVGGSFVGMEVAATLSELGLAVTVLDQEPVLFAKLGVPKASEFLHALYRKRDIDIRLGETVVSFEGHDRVRALTTHSGHRFDCDLAVLAVGVTPVTQFLAGSGIAVNDGVLVDRQLQSSDPNIFAAGDVASVWEAAIGRYRRVEHWDSAVKQGRAAAKNMLGQRRRYDELSYFYCEVFDVSFEALRASEDIPESIERGSLADRNYALLSLKDDIPRALFTLGRPPQETRAIESLIRYRVNLGTSKARLADPDFALETIPNQTVLVLQGGGAMGAFECGVVKALEQHAIHPDIVAGVSIGAFNGAIIAGNAGCATAALESFWDELTLLSPDFGFAAMGDVLGVWQSMMLGSPQFFRPRWTQPILNLGQLPFQWTSLYDTSPMKALIERYVDFPKLKSSPVRLLVSAVNVETAELEVFDSYSDDLTADHILASGSLPLSFPWTTIHGSHYWDGGIVSNSPLDLVAERCGTAGKRVYIVDLYAAKRMLPSNFVEVLARRDEIVYAERIRHNPVARDLARDYGRLVEELMQELDPARAAIMKQRPRYTQLMGDHAPMTLVRIVREADGDETPGRDANFSAGSIRRNRQQGYATALERIAAQERAEGMPATRRRQGVPTNRR